jgi:hypothetical protein
MDNNTYTRLEAMQALGISSPNAFHSLRRRYPQAFIVTHKGAGKGDPTLYDKETLDQFIMWRDLNKMFKAVTDDPLAIILKKGKKS